MLSAATENVAAEPPERPVSTAELALALAPIDAPLSGPLASRTTYAVMVLPSPLAAAQDTVASLDPADAETSAGADGIAQDDSTAGRANRVEGTGELASRGSPRAAHTLGDASAGWNAPFQGFGAEADAEWLLECGTVRADFAGWVA